MPTNAKPHSLPAMLNDHSISTICKIIGNSSVPRHFWTFLIFTVFLFINNSSFGQSDPDFASITQDNKDFDILQLTDTLIICARFSECGEWGGHKEIFIIFHKDSSKTMAIFTKDTLLCKEGYLEDKRKIIYKTSKTLSSENLVTIQKFLDELLNKSKEEMPMSHMGNLYYYYAKSHKLSVSFFDTEFSWKGFIELKKLILN